MLISLLVVLNSSWVKVCVSMFVYVSMPIPGKQEFSSFTYHFRRSIGSEKRKQKSKLCTIDAYFTVIEFIPDTLFRARKLNAMCFYWMD